MGILKRNSQAECWAVFSISEVASDAEAYLSAILAKFGLRRDVWGLLLGLYGGEGVTFAGRLLSSFSLALDDVLRQRLGNTPVCGVPRTFAHALTSVGK